MPKVGNARMNVVNLVSVSGGKDSTATLLLALERRVDNLQCVFADTGNEHDLTYEYLYYLEFWLRVRIQRVKADFTKQLTRKREETLEKWRLEGVANDIIAQAEAVLSPTGNPYLDLCLWKGRFPSAARQFCTEELKIIPITDAVVWPLLQKYDWVESWQGIRWDESPRRATYVEREGIEPDATRVFAYRPILSWTATDVFDFHRKHLLQWNPLYELGMGRVGCMPCINSRKGELKNIGARFPEVIERIAEWERLVSLASKRQSATFFCAVMDPTVKRDEVIHHLTHGVNRMVKWSNTERGGRVQLIATDTDPASCNSVYGLCE
jgi:3'-phosphoadenosine 5'-phosphosulfate sulfotransferase (PAPS reductase)/FAD synthetase